MIASLSGVVEEKGIDDAIVDVNGVGYRVFLSLRSMARLPEVGEKTKLRIRTVVREDALDLYGFTSAAEEKLFQMLTTVSHVGPKVALNVLSGMDPGELAHAISSGDIARLTKLHGVGKKTAERLVVELKDKVKTLNVVPLAPESKRADASSLRADLINALVNMGYRPAQAEKAADMAEERAGEGATLDQLIREALRAARAS